MSRASNIGFGSVLVGVGALLALWPQAQPVIDGMLLRFGWIVLHQQTHAIAAGVLIGAGLSWRVAHALPSYFSPAQTRMRLQVYCSTLTFALAWFLSPLAYPWGAVWAACAGLFGQWALLAAARVVYLVAPSWKPESMK